MAASSLVAVPEPAGSRAPSSARVIEPAHYAAFSIALPAGSTATSILEPDTATRSAERLEPGSAIPDVAVDAIPIPEVRPRVAQPPVTAVAEDKNAWRFDRNISWFGPGLYGSGTACGQRYSKTLMGVAHRTLPCGTLVTFRNPANGRQLTVPVIDRGPYVSGRQWDMSKGLCSYLGHCYTGSIQWRFGGG
jgi:rare lipoprotein A (peptidoglycan hydrolase)